MKKKTSWNWKQKKYVICGIAAVVLIGYAFYIRAGYGEFAASIMGLVTICLGFNTIDKKIKDPLKIANNETEPAKSETIGTGKLP